jgi:hypothetical protein
VAILVTVFQATLAGRRAVFTELPASRWRLLKMRGMTAGMHVLQPLARLMGRISERGAFALSFRFVAGHSKNRERSLSLPRSRTISVWYETWDSNERRLEQLESTLRLNGAHVTRGGEYDRWDLEVGHGMLGAARIRMTAEEHGSGKQMIKWRVWPRVSGLEIALTGLCAGTTVALWARGGATGIVVAVTLIVGLVAWISAACGARVARIARELHA